MGGQFPTFLLRKLCVPGGHLQWAEEGRGVGHRGVEASCCHPPPGARQENTFIPNCMSAPDCDPACCIHPANTLQLNVFDKEGNWYLIVLLRTIELVGHYCSSFFKAFFFGGGRGAKQLLCLAKVIARGFQFLFFFPFPLCS